MLVNAILYQEVLIFDEKAAKFFVEDTPVIPPAIGLRGKGCDGDGIEFRLMSEKKGEMFASKPAESRGIPVVAWAVAGLAVVVVVGVLAMMGRHKVVLAPTTVQELAAYAGSLPLSQLTMSESTSLSGGKSTFVDGHIQNTGSQTVTGITVQVIFRNEEAMPPQIETLPLTLIRTREPYIDTQPVGAAPLKPGDERDFRLIFESIAANWNGQMPEIRVIQVETK
jgi:hypothetical protein